MSKRRDMNFVPFDPRNTEGCGVGKAVDVGGKLVGNYMVVLNFRRTGMEPLTAIKLACQLVFLAVYCWCARIKSRYNSVPQSRG